MQKTEVRSNGIVVRMDKKLSGIRNGVARRAAAKGILATLATGLAAVGLSKTAETQRSTDYSGLLLPSPGTSESRAKLATQVIDRIRTSIEQRKDGGTDHGGSYLHQADYKFSDNLWIGVAFEINDNKISAFRLILTQERAGAIGDIEIEAATDRNQIGDVRQISRGFGVGRPVPVPFGDSVVDLQKPENRETLLRFYNGILTFLVAQG